jgi:DNA-binding IclR family transcriptional regulator
MSPSTAHFYLSSYIRVGLIVQAVSGGHYDLGPSAVRLGLAALARFDIVRRAREAMFEIRKAVEGSVLLTVWGNLGPTVIYHLEGAHRSPLEGRVGSVLPILSATGCAFLAHFPRQEREEIIRTELTRPQVQSSSRTLSRRRVEKILAEVRQHGIARIPGLYGYGYTAVAAPVFDHTGSPRVALSVLLDRKHSDIRVGGPIVRSLLAITRGLSAEIGGDALTSRPGGRSKKLA